MGNGQTAASDVSGDLGHKEIKIKSDQTEIVYPHGLVELSDIEFKQICQRAGGSIPDGYALVNGVPYAFGKAAIGRGDFMPRTGARRYTADYYGVQAAIGFFQLFDQGRAINYFGSYPSELVDYRDELLRSVIGEWTVKMDDAERKYRVVAVDAMDEPICGLYNLILTKDGRHYQRNDLYGGTSLVIDIGGGTTDIQGVNPQGEPDYNITHTVNVGINKVIDDFKRAFRHNNKDDFASLDSISNDKVNTAIRIGTYVGAGRKYKCESEVNAASNALVKNIRDFYENRAGGPTRWDHIVLTGGGSALLESQLRRMLRHDDVIAAEEPECMHLANVRGAHKLAKFYEADRGNGS